MSFEEKRTALESMMRAQQAESNAAKQLAAQQMFAQRTGLNEAIAQEIAPNVVSVQTEGTLGAASFWTQGRLISNAHILPDQDATLAAQLDGRPIGELRELYTRPAEFGNHPDVTEAQVVSHHTGIDTMFPFDESNGDSLFFYYDPNHITDQPQFIRRIHDADTLGLLAFQPEGGHMPQAGSSGSPIIEAKVFIINGKPTWRFISTGVLFAKHATQQRLYAAPIATERQQILSIKQTRDEKDRSAGLALASHALGECKSTFFHLSNMQQVQAQEQRQLADYHAGVTPTPIKLPDGLVPLQGTIILPISQSYWLTNGDDDRLFKTHLQKDVKITKELLEEQRDNLLTEVNNPNTVISLKKSTNRVFENDFFRLDISFCKKSPYSLVDLQDNCRASKTKRLKIKGTDKSASSTFAIAKIYGAQSIDGATLVAILENSLKDRKTVIYPPKNKSDKAEKKTEISRRQQPALGFRQIQVAKKKQSLADKPLPASEVFYR